MVDPGPRRIALIYAAFGFLWILVSDTIAGWIATTPQHFAHIQTYKGWIFVGLTTILVYVLLRVYAGYRDRAQRDLIRANEKIVAALHEKEILVRELRHRVMNNLQSVTALISLAADQESPIETRERVLALSTCHEVALSFEKLSCIAPSEYISRMVEALWSLRSGCDGSIRPEMTNTVAEPLNITINHAIPIGMFIYEVCRYPSTGDGEASPPVTIVNTGAELRISAPMRVSGLAATLCDAWGIQAGGHVTHGDSATVLSIPQDGTPTMSWR